MTQIKPTKLGIAFSGGGGKGAYEIGVWKALKEFGIDAQIEAVSGTSVGSLNGALFVQGDLARAELLWLNISPDKVMSFNTDQLYRNIALTAGSLLTPAVLAKAVLAITQLNKFQGLFSPEGLKQLIDQSGTPQSVKHASLPFIICALNSASGKLEYPQLNGLTPKEITSWMLASSAIPLIFDGVQIDQQNYYDGGVLPTPFSDNTPYKPLIEQHACTHIINIFLQRDAEIMTAQKNYPQINFWNIVPIQAFDGAISALNFSAENAAKLIEQGYQDVKTILAQFKEFQDDEARYLQAVFSFGETDQDFIASIHVNQTLRERKKDSLPLEQVMQQLSQTLSQQEQAIIDSGIDTLLEEMQENSTELLEEAFTAITTLAATQGPINEQSEQGHFSRLLGSVTGRNIQQQGEINQGLNHAIYANQQLIQKLNHKQMLSMEAMVSLANKTSYLMNHVNLLHGGIQRVEQQLQQALLLMQQGIEALAKQCWQRFEKINARLEKLERGQLIENWYHQVKALPSQDNAYQTLLNVTASFYTQTGRAWTDNELCRYVNVLDDLGLKKQPLIAGTLLLASENSTVLETIGSQYIFPIAPSHQHFYPLLNGMQILTETTLTENICSTIEEQTGLSLATERPAVELGLELLHSWRSNDSRAPLAHTTQNKLVDNQTSPAQTQLLAAIDPLNQINDSLLQQQRASEDLAYLQQKISQFKVVVPIIGKFSSGKSTLLNHYLGKHYLKTNLAPETAFATELCYAENEHIVIHSLANKPPVSYPLTELDSLQADENLAFIQVFLNHKKLKNRSNLVLVDMPGFDARNPAHHKAIACYLARGDYFISLMPIDIPFDHSIMERLAEIHLDYDKPVSCLLSKAGRKPTSQRIENAQQLKLSLQQALGSEITVGLIETQDTHFQTLKDFEDQLDNASHCFDTLLLARYHQPLLNIVNQFEQTIEKNSCFAKSSEADIKQQITQAEQQFKQIESNLTTDIAQFENKLCNEGKEKLIQQASQALKGSTGALVNAAKSNHLNEAITEILRPVIQIELDQLIQSELEKLETKLETLNRSDKQLINVAIQVSPEQKQQFSFKSAMIGAGVSALLFGPVGVLVTSLLSGFLGKKDNAEERDRLITEQIQTQVIPQALNQVIDRVSNQLLEAVNQLKQNLRQSFQQQRSAHQKQIKVLQATQKEKRQDYEAKLKEYEKALSLLSSIKDKQSIVYSDK